MALNSQRRQARQWLPDYAALRRWHFYAGLFCLPFFCWLAITGTVYLFRPQIEAWLDRPYENLHLDGPRAAPSAEARAAVEAVSGSFFSHYEPPLTPTGASQVVVMRRDQLLRVYIHPATLQAMDIVREDRRPMNLVAGLHGELLLGERGSMVVEVAGSWGVVMILTGLCLWLPRGKWQFGGVVYPRLRQQGRLFWRDLHSVAGLWISLVTLLLLLTGLPWSANWGNYLTWVRNHWEATHGAPDWPVGGTDLSAQPLVPSASSGGAGSSMPGMSPGEMASMEHSAGAAQPGRSSALSGSALNALDTLLPLAVGLQVPRPVWISPPARGTEDWTISSHAQNRPLRVTYTVAADGAGVTATQVFDDLNIVDKVVNVSVAAHEGQLFGWLNQAILLLNALGVLVVTASATVMWLRRRPSHSIGAPPPTSRPHFAAPLVIAISALAVLLPMFGLSLCLVLAVDRIFIRRLPAARRWLGLLPPEI